MHNSPPTEHSGSGSLGLSALRREGVQHCTEEAFVRRESLLWASWKPISLSLIESPHEELLLTIRKRQGKIEEVLNITYSRISKRLAKVDKYYSFGVIIPSKKKYMFACRTEALTVALYNKIVTLRNDIRTRHEQLEQEPHQQLHRELLYEESNTDGLLFERCLSEKEPDKCFSTNVQTPKRRKNIESMNYIQEKEREKEEEKEREREREETESYCTAQQEQQQLEEQLKEVPQMEQTPLHLQQVISPDEVECLQSDEGFKLLCNFNEGRFLARSHEYLKVNLLAATSLGPRELLQSFFHLQLWNSRVKEYKVLNRIERGIYLVKLQLHRQSLFSLPRYCYMMVHTCILEGDYLLLFRGLPQQHFEQQFAYNWLHMDLWVRVKQSAEEFQRLMNICGRFGSQKDFESGHALLEQIRSYQLFLKTMGHLPQPTLEWPQEMIEVEQV